MYMYSTGALFPRIQSLSNDDSNSNTAKQKVHVLIMNRTIAVHVC